MMNTAERESAIQTNLEIAMRSLARAAALADENWGHTRTERADIAAELSAAQDAGKFYMLTRAVCAELGAHYENVVGMARHYASAVADGRMNVV